MERGKRQASQRSTAAVLRNKFFVSCIYDFISKKHRVSEDSKVLTRMSLPEARQGFASYFNLLVAGGVGGVDGP